MERKFKDLEVDQSHLIEQLSSAKHSNNDGDLGKELPQEISEMEDNQVEKETDRWNYIKEEVKRMKLLMEKYPKFANREGSANIILPIDSLFNSLENCRNPSPLDLDKVEGQLEHFKDTLLQGFQQDLEKWKLKMKNNMHNVLKKIAIVLLFVTSLLVAMMLYNNFVQFYR